MIRDQIRLTKALEKDIREACKKTSPEYCYYCEVLLKELDRLRAELKETNGRV